MEYSEYVRHDALGLARLVAERQIQPSELLALARGRLDEVNPSLNAVIRRMDTIADARAIATSFPDFTSLMRGLGASL